MGELDVLDVYRKIKEIRDTRKSDKEKQVSIDEITRALDADKAIITEYITALTILEFVAPTGNGNIILLR
jgi:hypothetical protein